ncbi:asparagine synthase-related protein [Streptomyces longispororuber]|uniref:asparagine synthase-related protein n=1 Tax=Streptomyces longispororuber TaxID=68230 RepID=UPI0033F4E705
MFKLRFEGVPAPEGWRFDGHRWWSGASWIEPFSHPALGHVVFVARECRRAVLIVREVATGQPQVATYRHNVSGSGYRRMLIQADRWPLQVMRVEVAGGQPVRITCGPRGVAPLYLRVTGNRLDASWDVLDLAPDPADVNGREATACLAYRPRYSTATLFRSIHRLTERATASWSPTDGLSLTYPEAALHSRPRVLRDDADPVVAFTSLLRQEITARPLLADQCAIELSGGMDSTMTALATAETVGAAHTAALLLGGPAGAQQARRRRQISGRAGLGPDVTVPVADCAPFRPDGPRATGRPWSPLDGTYAEAMSELYARLREAGVRWVLTGIGGDELCFQRPEERARSGDPWNLRPTPAHLGPRARHHLPHLTEDLAPASVLHASTVASLGVHSATAMRHGLWPISPLATPLILRLAESLPHAWRRNKHLMRRVLEQAGYSHEVAHPPLPENFTSTCEDAMTHHGRPLLERWLPDLFLAELDLINPDQLAAQCADVAATGHGASELYRPLALEAALRTLSPAHA